MGVCLRAALGYTHGGGPASIGMEGERRFTRAALGDGFGRGGLRQCFLTGKSFNKRESQHPSIISSSHISLQLLAWNPSCRRKRKEARCWRKL